MVLGERSAMRISKLGLRGLESPFVCAPFDVAEIYLNAFRGVATEQRSLLRRRKFGRNVLSDRRNRGKRWAEMVNSGRVSMALSLFANANCHRWRMRVERVSGTAIRS